MLSCVICKFNLRFISSVVIIINTNVIDIIIIIIIIINLSALSLV